MSEKLPGVPPAPPPPPARDAAAVLLVRSLGSATELFWVLRGQEVQFARGFHAFPGGGLDATDWKVPVQGASGMEAALRVAAARELFEETGILVARGEPRPGREVLARDRKALLGRKLGFGALLEKLGLALVAEDFVDAGRWITPPYAPLRFDARFFLVEVARDASAEVWPGEIATGEWVTPEAALSHWRDGSALLHPPNLHGIRVLAEYSARPDIEAKLRSPDFCPAHIATRIEFQQGIRVFPLETETLPPATHTNCLILGNGELLVVDPGGSEVRQYARLLALLSGLQAEGKRVKAVVLTHHHKDHVAGAAAVSDRLHAPVWCHPKTEARLPFRPDRLLEDGEVLSLAGAPNMAFRVWHTPGHARGHLCLVDEASRAAVVGDMVAGVGTILIDPPEGDMSDYVAQLERLRALPVTTLYPAHGPIIADGPGKLFETIRHREYREKLVLETIGKGGATVSEIVPQAYQDLSPEFHLLAERSTQAILIKLVRDGKLTRTQDRYFVS